MMTFSFIHYFLDKCKYMYVSLKKFLKKQQPVSNKILFAFHLQSRSFLRDYSSYFTSNVYFLIFHLLTHVSEWQLFTFSD